MFVSYKCSICLINSCIPSGNREEDDVEEDDDEVVVVLLFKV
jgi:hypothetical protein